MKWVIRTKLTKAQFPQRADGNCQAVRSLVKTYGSDGVENACHMRMTETSTASLRVLTNILKNNRDLAMKDSSPSSAVYNDNVRGANAFTKVNDGKEVQP